MITNIFNFDEMTNFTERQKQIIQASLDLIATSGIHGLTIKNISKDVGISEPAIYRHFASKTDILFGIISKIKESLSVDLAISADETKRTIDIIREGFMNRAKRFTNNPSIAAVIFSEEIFYPSSRMFDVIKTIMEDSQTKMIKIIQRGQSKNDIIGSIEAEELSLMIIGSFRLLVTNWHMSKNSFDLENRTEKLINAFKQLI